MNAMYVHALFFLFLGFCLVDASLYDSLHEGALFLFLHERARKSAILQHEEAIGENWL